MQVAVGPVPRRIPLAAAMFDMSRGRQALLSVAQPVLCVLIALGRLPGARVALLGTVAALAGELAVYSLNETGMFLVEALCEGAPDADALAARLVDAFEVDETTARADVAEFIEELSKLMKS